MISKITLLDTIPYIKLHDKTKVIKFIQTDNRSFVPLMPDKIVDAIQVNDELRTDVYWYAEIYDYIDVNQFACIHLAYASSEKLNNIINKEDKLYLLKFDRHNNEGIVIGNCPWCGKKLNTFL